MAYFTDRNLGARARVNTEMDEELCKAIVRVIQNKANDGLFGLEYPEQCDDGRGVIGTDIGALRAALVAHNLPNPFQWWVEHPTTYEVLDLIEFAYEKIAQPIPLEHHPYPGHYHLRFDREAGRVAFREEVNRIFERNGIAYELRDTGQVDRIAPEVLREALTQAVFNTGDEILDRLLEEARTKFLSRDPVIRRESLERLWDAWERLKTMEDAHKPQGIKEILNKAAVEPNFRKLLEEEAKTLTKIGNDYIIRHAEVDKIPINDDEHVDYLFHRLFALIRLLLRKSNRGG